MLRDAGRGEEFFPIESYLDYGYRASPAMPEPLSGPASRVDGHVHEAHATPDAGAPSVPYLAAKRLFDIVFAASFLVVALPALLILAIILQIDSPGRLFFIQQRVGKGGKMFGCIKFRTMHENAEELLADMLARCPETRREWESDHKLRNDCRVSRFGKIVRKLSLDELPQLVNILRGEMSVVGPRPIVSAEIAKYGEFFADYTAVKPGLTGLWQVSGRNDISYQERVQLDVQYRARASMMFDLSIVLRTVPAVVASRGSY